MSVRMIEGGIGRILVASLHQSIGDALPQRLEYYEHWLTPMGLRDRRSSLAPLGAVLSFLRQEGLPAYDEVMRRAGRASAEWRHAELRPGRGTRWLPGAVRARLALRHVRRLVTEAYAPARVHGSIRRGVGTVEIRESVFCGVRDPWPWPTCRYFAAAAERQLELLGVPAAVTIDACRAVSGDVCRLRVDTTHTPGGGEG